MGILRPSWGHLGGVLGVSWAAFARLGLLGRVLGRLGYVLGYLGPSWAVLRSSWAVLGTSWGRLGPSWGRLGRIKNIGFPCVFQGFCFLASLEDGSQDGFKLDPILGGILGAS